jgi:hypothetical protein
MPLSWQGQKYLCVRVLYILSAIKRNVEAGYDSGEITSIYATQYSSRKGIITKTSENP